MSGYARRILQLLRRVIGITQLEAKIVEAISLLKAIENDALFRHNQLLQGLDDSVSKAPPDNAVDSIKLPILCGAVSQRDILRFCNLFSPSDVQGFAKVRMGNEHDGGYVFVDDFSAVDIVVSCGISNDVTCDLDFANLGKSVLQFDHTVDGPPESHPNFRFFKRAIDISKTTLWGIAEAEGNASSPNLILKIDIDGGEWEVFANFPNDQMKRFRQIACEFHWSSKLRDADHFALCVRAIENIREAFFPAYIHANNFVGFTNLMGVPMPEVFEVTFANKSLYRPGDKQTVHTPYDAPNDPGAPDLYLGSPFNLTQ